MGAHTLGPWTVGGDTQFMNQVEIWPAIGCAYGAGPEVIANAHLIAAAPDLLEALEDFLSSSRALCLDHSLGKEMQNASAALAKAKGETP